jgi:hypothetical protein
VWWVDAERVELISEQLAALAVAAGWAPADAGALTPDLGHGVTRLEPA